MLVSVAPLYRAVDWSVDLVHVGALSRRPVAILLVPVLLVKLGEGVEHEPSEGCTQISSEC